MLRYVELKPCITRLPENGFGRNVTKWPARLHTPPDRLQSIQYDAYISRNELFTAESKYWNEIIGSYVRALHWKKIRLRNVMDMRAGFGGLVYSISYLAGSFHLPIITLHFRHLAGLQQH